MMFIRYTRSTAAKRVHELIPLLLLSSGLIFLFQTATAQADIDKYYKIYDTRTHEQVPVEKITEAMSSADVLFFGEEHNDSAGHFLENKIFRALSSRYPGNVALSLEMFETDNQLVLNEYLNGQIDESRLGKDARLWSNYKDYRPMIEFAKQNHIPVIAANTPRRYVNMVSRRGMKSLDSLDKKAKMLLPPLPYDTLSGRYRDKFMDIMKGSPGSASANIYYSQTLWDAGMAYSIHKYLKNNKHRKIFHCVGKFHVEEKLGTAAQLHQYSRKLRIMNIICFSDTSFKKDALSPEEWDKFSILGDYIIITDPDLKKTY
jgi:uncharacterized iron-regulated protein